MSEVALALLVGWLPTSLPAWLPGASHCYQPADQTPGWKKVALPDDAPALAAPEDIEQFRGGEPALLVDDALDALQLESPSKWGQTSFSFRVDPLRTRWLEVVFVAGVQGAKVEVVGLHQGSAISLQRGRREGGRSVAIGWSEPFDLVVVTVHHHFRPSPVVHAVQLGQFQAPDTGVANGRTDRPAAYQAAGFLYFRHPGGRSVELCNREGWMPRYQRGYWEAAPTLVELRR